MLTVQCMLLQHDIGEKQWDELMQVCACMFLTVTSIHTLDIFRYLLVGFSRVVSVYLYIPVNTCVPELQNMQICS